MFAQEFIVFVFEGGLLLLSLVFAQHWGPSLHLIRSLNKLFLILVHCILSGDYKAWDTSVPGQGQKNGLQLLRLSVYININWFLSMANHARKEPRQQWIPVNGRFHGIIIKEACRRGVSQESERQMRKPETGKLDNFLFSVLSKKGDGGKLKLAFQVDSSPAFPMT